MNMNVPYFSYLQKLRKNDKVNQALLYFEYSCSRTLDSQLVNDPIQ